MRSEYGSKHSTNGRYRGTDTQICYVIKATYIYTFTAASEADAAQSISFEASTSKPNTLIHLAEVNGDALPDRMSCQRF